MIAAICFGIAALGAVFVGLRLTRFAGESAADTSRRQRLAGPAALGSAVVFALLAGYFWLNREPDPMFKPTGPPRVKVAMRLVKVDAFDGAERVSLPEEMHLFTDSHQKVTDAFVAQDAVLTNDDIAGTSVSPIKDQEHFPGQWEIRIFLTPAARKRFHQFTKENVRQWLAVYLDDRVRMVARLNEEIPRGVVWLGRGMDEATAKELAMGFVGH